VGVWGRVYGSRLSADIAAPAALQFLPISGPGAAPTEPGSLTRRRALHRAGARLQGHNGAGRGLRPRLKAVSAAGATDDSASGRFFLCALCRRQVLICSHCDRGQIYCVGDCRFNARRKRRRETGRRYQRSRNGRFNHAARSRRYRARQKMVTHQGSPVPSPDACVLEVSAAAREEPPSGVRSVARSSAPVPVTGTDATFGRCCHWCGRGCSPFVRREHLRRRRAVRFRPP
jgi:hypothetical protein